MVRQSLWPIFGRWIELPFSGLTHKWCDVLRTMIASYVHEIFQLFVYFEVMQICSHRKRASGCTTRADHAFKSRVSWDFIRLLYTPLLAYREGSGNCKLKSRNESLQLWEKLPMVCKECHSRSRDELAWQRCGVMHAFAAKVLEVCSNADLTKQSEEILGAPCTKRL